MNTLKPRPPTAEIAEGARRTAARRVLRREDLMVVSVAEAAARMGGYDTAGQVGERGRPVDLAEFVAEGLAEAGALEAELASFSVVGSGSC